MRIVLLILSLLSTTVMAASPYDWQTYPRGNQTVFYTLSTQWLLLDRGDVDPERLTASVRKHAPDAVVAEVAPLLADRVAVRLEGLPDLDALHALGAGLIHDELADRTWPAPTRKDGVVFFDDHLVVAFDAEPPTTLLKAAGVRLTRALAVPGAWAARAADGDAVGAAWALTGQPGVRWAEPDAIRMGNLLDLPNDPAFGDQWHLENAEDASDLDIDEAWSITPGVPDVVIGIFDNGFDVNHADFADKIVGGQDLVDRDDDPTGGCLPPGIDPGNNSPTCPGATPHRANHGTTTAGLAAARANNNVATAGVCPDCGLYLVRLFSHGNRPSGYADAFMRAGAAMDVMNNSWGHLRSRHFPMPRVEYEAFDFLLNDARDGKGVVVVFGSGNSFEPTGNDPYPAYPGIITVSASTRSNGFACYSSYGEHVSIAAPSGGCYPGEIGLTTTDYTGLDGYSDGDVARVTGTSAAAPVVSGLAGLMLSANPELTADQVRLLMQATAVKIVADKNPWVERLGYDLAETFAYDEYGFSPGFGYGRIDAAAAVAAAVDPPTLTGAVCDDACPRCIDNRCAPDCAAHSDCPGESRCIDVEDGRACVVPKAKPGDIGTPCSMVDCAACVTATDITFFGAEEVCTDVCDSDADCPSGFDCRPLRRNAPDVCVPGEADCGTLKGEGPCLSGVYTNIDGVEICLCQCGPGDSAPCPGGLSCTDANCWRTEDGSRCSPNANPNAVVCFPGDDYQLPCTTHAECPQGQFCIDQICAPDRAPGGCDLCTPCSDDNACGARSECVDIDGSQRCLAPCEPQAGDCPADAVCVAVDGLDGNFCVNPAHADNGICGDQWRCRPDGRCFDDAECPETADCIDNQCVEAMVDAGLPDMQADGAPVDAGVVDADVTDGAVVDQGVVVLPPTDDGDDGGCDARPGAPWQSLWWVIGFGGLLCRRRAKFAQNQDHHKTLI